MPSHEDLLMETVNEGHWERPSPVSVCAAIFLEQELSIDVISQDSSELGVGGEWTVGFLCSLKDPLDTTAFHCANVNFNTVCCRYSYKRSDIKEYLFTRMSFQTCMNLFNI